MNVDFTYYLPLISPHRAACRVPRPASTRSPWSNEYDPPLEDGAVPSAKLRELEIQANQAFDTCVPCQDRGRPPPHRLEHNAQHTLGTPSRSRLSWR